MRKLIGRQVYGVVPLDILESDTLSLKAKGLYAYIQSKPYNWEFDSEKIASKIKEDNASIQSALNELIRHRYLEIVKVLGENNVVYECYRLHETPHEKEKKRIILGEKPKSDKFDFKKNITDLVGEQYIQEINDFLLIRKKKNATNSKTAFGILKSEIEKSRRTPIEVVRICIEKDWKGFKADWLNAKNTINGRTEAVIGVDRRVIFDKA